MQSFIKVLILILFVMHPILVENGIREVLKRYYNGGSVFSGEREEPKVWDSAGLYNTDSTATNSSNFQTDMSEGYNSNSDTYSKDFQKRLKYTVPSYVGAVSGNRSGAERKASRAMLMDGLVSRGFTPMSAAALVGNIEHESGGFKSDAIGDTHLKDHAYGLMQLRLDRLDRLIDMCDDPSDPDCQMDHMANELLGGIPYESGKFKTAASEKDLMSMVSSMMTNVFRPNPQIGAESLPHRKNYATLALSEYMANQRNV